jgi:hypothetical protein
VGQLLTLEHQESRRRRINTRSANLASLWFRRPASIHEAASQGPRGTMPSPTSLLTRIPDRGQAQGLLQRLK